jgi:hypothetical protein
LVNGAIINFNGFAESEIQDNILHQPPPYMLVKLLHDREGQIRIPTLPTSVVPIKPKKFTHNKGHGKSASLEQFPVTLAFAITDYKCQGKTFDHIVVDLKKPSGGGPSAPTSAYVQLSRARALDRVSIMRPFSVSELNAPLPPELEQELAWQEEMEAKTLRTLATHVR